MSRTSRYPNQFFEPTPVTQVEWVLGIRRHLTGLVEPRSAQPEPPPARRRASLGPWKAGAPALPTAARPAPGDD